MKPVTQRKAWLVVVLALPVLLLALDAAYGQRGGQNPRPPVFPPQQPPQPIQQPPIIQPPQPVFNPPPQPIIVWYCSRCRRELGRGGPQPVIDVCPGCGARLNGSGFTQGPTNFRTPVNPEAWRTGALVLGGIVLGLGVFVGGGFLIYHLCKPSRCRKGNRARRRRRDDDDDDDYERAEPRET